MQYEASSPVEYLQLLEEDWRKERLLALRDMLLRLAPELKERIVYKMLGYELAETLIVALNAQKGYVSLYIGDIDKVDPNGTLLKKTKRGKGCIRFSKTVTLEETGIELFLERALAMAKSGEDIGCQ